MITGGARGITAKVAIEFAKRYRCTLELVGRSPMPRSREYDHYWSAKGRNELRQILIKEGYKKPVEIEGKITHILALKEMVATVETIKKYGGNVHYHSVDVRDDEAFGKLIEGIYNNRGRIDGVIHGAGILDDKLIRDKSPHAFTKVFDTKVNGALTLTKRLHDNIGFVVFFSSIVGVFGNKGQVDYAAANDALDQIAHWYNNRIDGKVLSINWGPWRSVGMVSEGLEKLYKDEGIYLISQEKGVTALMNELESFDKNISQVILMCSDPDLFLKRQLGVGRLLKSQTS